MANLPYLAGREITTISLSLHMWNPVTAGIKPVFRGSSKWWVFGTVLRKYCNYLNDSKRLVFYLSELAVIKKNPK